MFKMYNTILQIFLHKQLLWDNTPKTYFDIVTLLLSTMNTAPDTASDDEGHGTDTDRESQCPSRVPARKARFDTLQSLKLILLFPVHYSTTGKNSPMRWVKFEDVKSHLYDLIDASDIDKNEVGDHLHEIFEERFHRLSHTCIVQGHREAFW